MKRKATISHLALACALGFALLCALSAVLMIAHAGHSCLPGRCPACEQIHIVKRLMETLAFVLLLFGLSLNGAGLWAHGRARRQSGALSRSPVSLKIRMNN